MKPEKKKGEKNFIWQVYGITKIKGMKSLSGYSIGSGKVPKIGHSVLLGWAFTKENAIDYALNFDMKRENLFNEAIKKLFGTDKFKYITIEAIPEGEQPYDNSWIFAAADSEGEENNFIYSDEDLEDMNLLFKYNKEKEIYEEVDSEERFGCVINHNGAIVTKKTVTGIESRMTISNILGEEGDEESEKDGVVMESVTKIDSDEEEIDLNKLAETTVDSMLFPENNSEDKKETKENNEKE